MEILTVPLGLLHLPAGLCVITATFIGFIAASRLHHGQVLPLWACIAIGAGIVGIGAALDWRFGYIE